MKSAGILTTIAGLFLHAVLGLCPAHAHAFVAPVVRDSVDNACPVAAAHCCGHHHAPADHAPDSSESSRPTPIPCDHSECALDTPIDVGLKIHETCRVSELPQCRLEVFDMSFVPERSNPLDSHDFGECPRERRIANHRWLI